MKHLITICPAIAGLLALAAPVAATAERAPYRIADMMPMQGSPGQGAPVPGAMPGGIKDDKMLPSAQAAPAPCCGAMPMSKPMAMPPEPLAAPLDHVEGRIAFIKAELGITDAQAPAWDAFAQALRSGREHLAEARQALPASAGRQSDVAAAWKHTSITSPCASKA